jgi:hypothetical protein
MSEKIIPIEQIEKERDHLSRCLIQRESFVKDIGTGEVKVGSSFESTLRVGRVKGLVRTSMNRIQGELDNLNQELDAYSQARSYLGQISLRQAQLSQIGQMVDEGNLTPDIYELHKAQLEELTASSQTNPILIRGLKRIQLEEEAKNEVSPVVPPTHETSEPLKESEESEKYRLPNGQKVGGKIAQLLYLLEKASSDNPLTSDQITQAIWPDVDDKSAKNRLNVSVSRLRANSEDTGLDIIIILDPSKRRKGQKASYYLKKEKPDTLLPEPDFPKTEKISDEIVCRQTQEISSLDKEIASINKPEYGTLSRADIDAIASAILCYEESLKSILEANNVRLIDQSILTELQELTGDTPLANFSKMTKEQHCQFANQFRIQALQKAKTLLESPKINQILDEIAIQDSNVWCLLINLSEMDKVEVTVWNEGIVKQGITFLTDLVANPEARKQGFSVKTNPN